MPVAFRNVGTVATATTGAAAPGLPTNWQPNDIHVLVIEAENEPTPAMTGWNNVGSGTIALATGTVTSLTIRWRRAVGGDTTPSVPASTGGSAGKHTICRIIGFSGCLTTGDPWHVSLFATENVSDTTVSFPNPSTTVANTMVVHVFTTGQDTNTAQSSGAGTNAGLTGLANRMNNWTSQGGGGGLAMITGTKAGTGAIGITTTTITTANVKCLFTGALREATAAPATATPAVIATIAALPAPTVGTGTRANPAVIATASAVGSTTVAASSTVQPVTVATVAVLPAASVQTGTNATPTPATVTTAAAVPSATVSTGARVNPATVATGSTLPAAGLSTGQRVNPAAVATVATVGAVAVSTGLRVTAVTVATVSAVGAPTVSAPMLVVAVTVATVVALPSPTVRIGSTIGAQVIATLIQIGAVTIDVGAVPLGPQHYGTAGHTTAGAGRSGSAFVGSGRSGRW